MESVVQNLSKTIVNLLKEILIDMIYGLQSTFMLKHGITNDALVIFDIFHHKRRTTIGEYRTGALKLDVNEACDMAE